MIELRGIEKRFQEKNRTVTALSDVSLFLKAGEMAVIAGESGSGKSTLLSILGGMLSADQGTYSYDGKQLNVRDFRKMESFRREKVGIIVQNFALIPFYTIYENIELPLRERKEPKEARKEKILRMLDEVGLAGAQEAYPDQLSGGEQQRAAICRAMIGNPGLLLADEPTGALDEENERNILQHLRELAKKGTTVVVATHSKGVMGYCDRIIRLHKGRIVGGKDEA
ncbi:MAG: ABC transporter ATP-binding protein [Lachnospiraceae bacterium]